MRLPPGQIKKLNELAMKRAHLRTSIVIYKNQTKQQSKNPIEDRDV